MYRNLLLFTAWMVCTSVLQAQEQIVLEDHFDSNSETFVVGNHGNYSSAVEDGHYTIKIKPNSAFWFTNYTDIDTKEENFTYEATIEQKKGAKSTYYGIVIGLYGDKSDYSIFFVNNQGYFFVTHYYSGKFHNNIDKKFSSAILKSGPQQLKVVREFNVCKYFVNGVQVFEDASRSYYGPGYGIQIEKKGEYWVDDVKITKSKKVYRLVDNPIMGRKMENMGWQINTTKTEIAPIISPDGKTLYFVREGDPRNIGGTKQDVWYSTLDQNGEWTEARNLGFPINNSGSNFIESINPDNNTVYVGNTYTLFGEADGKGISVGYKRGNRWTIPQTIYIPQLINYDDYVDYYPDISNQFIMMAIDNGKTYGHKDIFISFRDAYGNYSAPMNLGPTINTCGDEFGIVLAADGKTLYFNSYGHTSYGSADVFVTKRLDDTWTNWTTPLNLGPEINSEDWEGQITVSADGEYGYISTAHNVYNGSEDIFRFKMGKAKPEPVLLVYGRVLDPKTLLPIGAEIKYYDLETEALLGTAVSDDVTGEYKIVLPQGRKYGFYAQKEGYYPVSENVAADSLNEYGEISKNLFLSKVELGEVIRLNNIFFDTDLADLKPASEAELKRLYDFLVSNPAVSIEISGHTDDRGSDTHNQVLSQARVNAVIAWLLEHGIVSSRLKGTGYGEARPIASNQTEEGRAMNRRVEFKVVSK